MFNFFVFCFCFRDFENILKQMKWPFTMKNSTDISKLDSLKQHFQCIANNLLKIQLPYPF